MRLLDIISFFLETHQLHLVYIFRCNWYVSTLIFHFLDVSTTSFLFLIVLLTRLYIFNSPFNSISQRHSCEQDDAAAKRGFYHLIIFT